jgi:hypothetical protein
MLYRSPRWLYIEIGTKKQSLTKPLRKWLHPSKSTGASNEFKFDGATCLILDSLGLLFHLWPFDVTSESEIYNFRFGLDDILSDVLKLMLPDRFLIIVNAADYTICIQTRLNKQ